MQIADDPDTRSGFYYRAYGAHGGGRNYVLALARNEKGRREVKGRTLPLYYRLVRPMTGYSSQDVFWKVSNFFPSSGVTAQVCKSVGQYDLGKVMPDMRNVWATSSSVADTPRQGFVAFG